MISFLFSRFVLKLSKLAAYLLVMEMISPPPLSLSPQTRYTVSIIQKRFFFFSPLVATGFHKSATHAASNGSGSHRR